MPMGRRRDLIWRSHGGSAKRWVFRSWPAAALENSSTWPMYCSRARQTPCWRPASFTSANIPSGTLKNFWRRKALPYGFDMQNPVFQRLLPIGLLFLSNLFMTIAWYGHLKYKSKPLLIVIVV